MKTKKSNKKDFGLLSILLVAIVAFFFASPVFAEEGKATLSFDSNGGSAVEAREVECDKEITNLPTPTKEKFKFQYWELGNGVEFKNGDKLPECGNTRLKAVWKESCDDACKRCRDFIKGQAWTSLYKVSIKAVGDDTSKLKISMDEPGRTSGVAKFKVNKVEFWDVDKDYNDKKVRQSFTTENSLESSLGIKKDARLSPSSSITLIHNQTVFTRIKIYLTPVGNWSDKELVSVCGDDAKLEIEVVYDKYGGAGSSESQLSLNLPDPGVGTGGIIDCGKAQTAGSFEEAYCKDYNNAKNNNAKVYTFDGTGNTFDAKKYSTVEFKCNPFKQLENDIIPPTVSETKKDQTLNTKYYENVSYLLGTMNFEHSIDSYVRHYTAHVENPSGCLNYLNANKGTLENKDTKIEFIQDDKHNEIYYFKVNGKSIDACKMSYDTDTANVFKNETRGNQDPIKCNITCNEVVTVEYGYPVASRAGLCFDYKVKVTSRVNCSSEAPNKPKFKVATCNPEPGCDHGRGFVDHAAGPSEEFDSCVAQCDGGKYTTKCASQCYNKIYGRGVNALTKTDAYDFADFVATKLDEHGNSTADRAENAASCQGHYYRTGTAASPVVKWSPANVFGRWYCDNNAVTTQKCLKTTAQGGGISAICGCSAKCRWNRCSSNEYLNPGVSEVDDVLNLVKYREAIETCNHYSKCSETQATFNFKVDYTDEKNEVQTINFPYSTSNPNLTDTIQYSRSGHSVMCTSESNKLNTTILQSNGCYKCAEKDSGNDTSGSSNNWYMTEWTFPGTWINNKTGEISYEPKTGAGWDKYSGKFCLPKNAGNVNRKWYNAYFIAKNGEDDIYSYFRETTTTESDMCTVKNCKKYERGATGEPTSDSSFTTADAGKLKYNIKASSRKFGLFGWNIDIKCFYAVNNNFPWHEEGKSCETSPACDPNEKDTTRIRSVDLANIFPAESGEKLTNPTTVGRDAVPFNWSQYASNTKTTDFTSQPSDYTAWVQSTNYKIYEGEEYLDYEIDLTKDLIAQLRSDNRNYTKFEGEMAIGSVYYYRSNLFRGNNPILRASSKFPNESVLGCNNIRNYRSTSCENVHGGDE